MAAKDEDVVFYHQHKDDDDTWGKASQRDQPRRRETLTATITVRFPPRRRGLSGVYLKRSGCRTQMLSAKRYDAIHNRRFQSKLALLLLHSRDQQRDQHRRQGLNSVGIC